MDLVLLYAGVLMPCLAFDLILSKGIMVNFRHKYPSQCNYFLIHAIFNMFVTYYSFPALYYSFTDIDKFIEIDEPSIQHAIIAFHIYHIIRYFRHMKFADWSHHIVAILSLVFSLYFEMKVLSIIVAFFMCGAPGILYYLPLYLSILGIMSKRKQKQINFQVSFIRCIGILYSTSISLLLWTQGFFIDIHWQIVYLTALMNIWNAMYFHTAVLADYYFFLQKDTKLSSHV
jgi:hypothetical protein